MEFGEEEKSNYTDSQESNDGQSNAQDIERSETQEDEFNESINCLTPRSKSFNEKLHSGIINVRFS